MGKTFVRVAAEHDESGQIRPLLLTWTNGWKDEIDRVTDVRQAPFFKRPADPKTATKQAYTKPSGGQPAGDGTETPLREHRGDASQCSLLV
ncbi:MAG: hypothetical protein P4N59_11980 [Negativicutes bacterium]|nr:hypothetical protein [Negativicutes bacterium]